MNENDTDAGHFGKEDPGSEPEKSSGGESAVAAPPSPVVASSAGDDPDVDGRHMGHLDAGHTHGPTDGQYFTIFWVLFALTALEVSTYFWESWFGEGDVVRRVGVAVLLTIMLIKFALIAGFFMHLRFDSALVRRVFIFGLIVAMVIYTVAMSAMNIWTDNGNPWFNDPPPEVTTTTLPDGG